jgi:anaerobic magnesium-protoporphyrin IX monomethyl ester cyclase
MNIVLIRPDDPRGNIAILSHSQPLNLGYLAAYLMQHGHRVEIWDYEVEKLTANGFIERIAKTQPQIIGFSCMTPTIINGHKLAGLVKEKFPDILTLVGGPHSTALPERSLAEFPSFDVVVIGEGEETLLALCHTWGKSRDLANIAGIAYRDAQGIHVGARRPLIEDLDKLPFPQRDMFYLGFRRGHISAGISNKLTSTEICTSRGCPIGCSFCASGVTMGSRTRFRSTENVLAEAEECLKKYNFDHLEVNDDTFTLNPDRAIEICRGFKKLGVRSWHCEGTRVNAVSLELLKIMAQTGCQKVAFGVESGSPRILDLIGKKITVEQVKNAFRWAREAGIKYIEGYYMIGSDPSETVEDLQMTINLIKETKPDLILMSILVPYPGTKVYEKMKEKNYIFTENWEKYVIIDQLPPWRTEYFSPEDLLCHQKRMLRDFYLRPEYLLSILAKLRSLEEIKYWSEAGWGFVKWLIKGRLT